jgi:hypothetical protein
MTMKRTVLPWLALLAGALTTLGAEQLLTAATNTSFQVRNRKYGDLLRPRDASNRDGAPIVLYPGQPWKCMIWRFTDDGKCGFRLKNHFTSKSFGPATVTEGKPTPVQQVPCAADAHDAPGWTFVRQADGSYRVGQPGTDLVLTAAESPEGTRVVLAPWRNADEQKWDLLKAPENPTM